MNETHADFAKNEVAPLLEAYKQDPSRFDLMAIADQSAYWDYEEQEFVWDADVEWDELWRVIEANRRR